MKLVSSLAIVVSLLVGGTVVAPAAAQNAPAAEQAQRKFKLSKEAQKAIGDLQAAMNAKAADFPQKLAAAQAVAKNSDDKYVIGKFQLQNAIDTGDKAAQAAAVEAILASGGADAAEAKQLNLVIASQAYDRGDFARAEAAYTAISAANPNDLESVVNLARAKMELKKEGEALALLQKAIGLSKTAGQNPPESWYRNAVSIAHKQNNAAVASELAREAIKYYPNKSNFQNLMAISPASRSSDEEIHADLMRLRQVSGTLSDAGDYLRFAQYLEYGRNWGEAKAVLDAAARAGKSTPAHAALLAKVSARIAEDKAALPSVEPKAKAAANGSMALNLASVYAGYGNYAKAAELYRIALQKGGVDANLVNTRLGIAHAMAGQRAEAETAFRAVTGARADLAGLWLAWLAQRS
jgi:hypothetical protein